MILLTSSEALVDRVEVSRRGASGFIHRSRPASHVVDAVRETVERRDRGQAKVLAVDDDPAISDALAVLLAPVGAIRASARGSVLRCPEARKVAPVNAAVQSTDSLDALDAAAARDVRVAIVGAGFGGLGAAIRLREEGIDDVLILERAAELGGTWRENTYPGAACDVPSQLYSFSFALNPDWTRFYAPQAEILEYLRRTARERGLEECIRFGADLRSARWDQARQRWRIETAGGLVTAEALVAAAGPLSEPSVPDVRGLGSFTGTVFHSARWRHDHDLTGRRVAVIGTGASAAQFVPHVREKAAHTDVYQRTPGWILPRLDRAISPRTRALFRRRPAAQRLARNAIYYTAELLVVGLVHDKRALSPFEAIARIKLRRAVRDPTLRSKLTPNYRIGCKRIIFSDDYLPALASPDVELVTDAIARVEPEGILTADGTFRPVDTIILGTGFKAFDSPVAHRIVGTDGRSLAEAWGPAGPQAYVGTVVAGFPNLFLLIGPNTGLGNNSMINIIEAQVEFVVRALHGMEAAGVGAIDVRPEVQEEYNAGLQERMVGTAWTDGGCQSWYLTADGTNRTLWPNFSDAFRRRLRRFDLGDFRTAPGRR